jgi:hypothetical protein
MIAFKDFFKHKPPPRIRLPRPGLFVLIRNAPAERIEAEYDESGERMIKLIVYTRSR